MKILFIIALSFYSFNANADFVELDKTGVETHFTILDEKSDLKEFRRLFILSFINNFRDVTFEELHHFISAFNSNYKTVGQIIDGFENNFKKEMMSIQSGKSLCIQAVQKNYPVGFACFSKDTEEPDTVFVKHLVVDPEFQNRGIGKQLIFAIRTDPSLMPNVKTLLLVTSTFYLKSISFYKKIGFVENLSYRKKLDPVRYIPLIWQLK